MKLTDNFDARRLRPREPRRWRSRFGMFLALLLITLGALLTLAGAAALFGVNQFDSMTLDPEMTIASLLLGLILFWIGLLIRRRIRRRLYGPSGISLSPRLGKKR